MDNNKISVVINTYNASLHLAVPEHFLMANTTLLMTLVVLFTNISARKKLLAL